MAIGIVICPNLICSIHLINRIYLSRSRRAGTAQLAGLSWGGPKDVDLFRSFTPVANSARPAPRLQRQRGYLLAALRLPLSAPSHPPIHSPPVALSHHHSTTHHSNEKQPFLQRSEMCTAATH